MKKIFMFFFFALLISKGFSQTTYQSKVIEINNLLIANPYKWDDFKLYDQIEIVGGWKLLVHTIKIIDAPGITCNVCRDQYASVADLKPKPFIGYNSHSLVLETNNGSSSSDWLSLTIDENNASMVLDLKIMVTDLIEVLLSLPSNNSDTKSIGSIETSYCKIVVNANGLFINGNNINSQSTPSDIENLLGKPTYIEKGYLNTVWNYTKLGVRVFFNPETFMITSIEPQFKNNFSGDFIVFAHNIDSSTTMGHIKIIDELQLYRQSGDLIYSATSNNIRLTFLYWSSPYKLESVGISFL